MQNAIPWSTENNIQVLSAPHALSTGTLFLVGFLIIVVIGMTVYLVRRSLAKVAQNTRFS
jgi:uncharacterized membrane protein